MSEPRSSFILSFQYTSECLSHAMMSEIGFKVNEIVTTRETAIRYAYVHLETPAIAKDLNEAIKTLVSQGVRGTELFGYSSVDSSNTMSMLANLEDHPGFKTLVEHETMRGSEFHRWTAQTIDPFADFGFNKLKKKLLAKQSTNSAAGGSIDRGEGGYGGNRSTRNEEEEEPMPRPNETIRHSYGKRTAANPVEEDDDDATERGSSSGGKRQNRSGGPGPSGNELPESVPAYFLQFTNSILSNLSNTIGDRAGEASAKLRRVEDELEQQRRLTLIETAKTAAAEREQRRIAEEARKSKVVLFVFVFYDYVGRGFAVTELDFFCRWRMQGDLPSSWLRKWKKPGLLW